MPDCPATSVAAALAPAVTIAEAAVVTTSPALSALSCVMNGQTVQGLGSIAAMTDSLQLEPTQQQQISVIGSDQEAKAVMQKEPTKGF